ncbi:MAG: hypothetical protein NTZ52_04460 [Chlamydiae bacterium]|nr:hypothetical protein [Chlamydiota bacterium]
MPYSALEKISGAYPYRTHKLISYLHREEEKMLADYASRYPASHGQTRSTLLADPGAKSKHPIVPKPKEPNSEIASGVKRSTFI